MVDKELLTEKTKLLAEYISDLEEHAGIELNESQDYKDIMAVLTEAGCLPPRPIGEF